MNDTGISRRACLTGAGALVGAGATLGSIVCPTAQASSPARDSKGSTVIASKHNAVVAIASGQVRGYTQNDIFTFKGIPYAESTAGANRFMPPVKVKPWTGVRSSMHYGPVSPQSPRNNSRDDEAGFMFLWDDGFQGEDCLRINVWTSGLNDNKKRPVLVWLHGGGYETGSAQALRAYDGEALARRGDVVVVSVNHRLGAMGFFDLSQFGAQYAASGNVGMLDIVAALEWVRDNIAAFGGDPRCVTIFGQSGGGAKVASLLAMPAAQGLFHRAIVQSGSVLRVSPPERAQKQTQDMLEELDLERSRLAELQYMPYGRIVAAGVKVYSRQPAGLLDFPRIRVEDLPGWSPVNDGKIIAQHPFDPVATPLSAHVPLLVGTTLNEFGSNIDRPEDEDLTEAQVLAQVKGLHGEGAAQVIAVFRERTPQAKPFDIWSRIVSAPIRTAALDQCTRKAAQNSAPVYLYWFAWQTPVLDGRPRAFHGSDLPFCFNNAERCSTITGGGPEAIELAHKMSDAWVAFARTGNPNHPGLPHWPAFSVERVPTMIFDNRCRVQDAPDAKEQAALAQT